MSGFQCSQVSGEAEAGLGLGAANTTPPYWPLLDASKRCQSSLAASVDLSILPREDHYYPLRQAEEDDRGAELSPRRSFREHSSAYTLMPIKTTSCCLITQSCPTLCNPLDCSPARFLCPWDFPGKNPGVGCQALLDPGIEPDSPALAGRFFTTEPPGKPPK